MRWNQKQEQPVSCNPGIFAQRHGTPREKRVTIYRGWQRPNGRRDVIRTVGRDDGWLARPDGRPSVKKLDWDWGVEGPGAYELALALLVDIGMPCELAVLWAADMVRDILNHLIRPHWSLTTEDISGWVMDRLWVELGLGIRKEEGV